MYQIKFVVYHPLIFYGMQEHLVHSAICKQINLSSKTRYRLQVTLLKVNGKAVPVQATKTYTLNRGIALLIQTFEIDSGKWLTSCSSPFTSEKKKWYQLNWRLVRNQSPSGCFREDKNLLSDQNSKPGLSNL